MRSVDCTLIIYAQLINDPNNTSFCFTENPNIHISEFMVE